MNNILNFSEFYTAGGTLPLASPSYVYRNADKDLYNAIQNNEFCYVLTPRQMGKSSLMVKTAAHLRTDGHKVAVIDLTQIGTVSVEQWYLGILVQISKRLQITINVQEWWHQKGNLSPVLKFIEFITDFLLSNIKQKIILFIDEIDTTLKLDFTDDFFAAIRSIYNDRANNLELNRIVFVLLGVASPADLISDNARTPFNIGREFNLMPFTRLEGQILEAELNRHFPGEGKVILDEIFKWTNGHPYLTQKICQSVIETHFYNSKITSVKNIIEKLFLQSDAQKETNLQFVRDRMLTNPRKGKLLKIYSQILLGRKIFDNKNSTEHIQLKLSGLVMSSNGVLEVSNEIYRKVFDIDWVKKNTEVNWGIVSSVFLSSIVLIIGLFLLYDFFINYRATKAENCLTVNYPEANINKASCLYTLYNADSILEKDDYKQKASMLYFDMRSWEEQKALFLSASKDQEVFTTITEHIYISLADINKSNDSTKLLILIRDELKKMPETEKASLLINELNYWISAREYYHAGELSEALSQYQYAVSINKNNPSTLYEMSMVLVDINETENKNLPVLTNNRLLILGNIEKILSLTLDANSIESLPTPDVLSTIVATMSSNSESTVNVAPYSTTANPTSIQANETATISPNQTNQEILPTLNSIDVLSTQTPRVLAVDNDTIYDKPIQTNFLTYQQIYGALNNLILRDPMLVLQYASSNLTNYPNINQTNLINSSANNSLPTVVTNSTKTTGNDFVYFSETGHNLMGEFLKYYNNNPSSEFLYGYPITEKYINKDNLEVQYFQRARFEYHPELQISEKVRLTKLGVETYSPTDSILVDTSSNSCDKYPGTSYPVCFSFLEFFEKYGGISQFGNPISGFEYHNNLIVQYFEYARLEWQPWREDGNRVVIADLGKEYFDQKEEATSLLSPVSPNSGAAVIATALYPRAYVWKAVTLSTDSQMFFIIVKNQNDLPLSGAECNVKIYWPNGTTDTANNITDSNGTTTFSITFENQPYGSLIYTDISCSYKGITGKTTTSFRVWY